MERRDVQDNRKDELEKFRLLIILEQYRQAHEQRARDADIQWKILSFGNTLVGGILLSALFSDNVLILAILSGTAIPVSFYIYVAYRKGLYFENMDSENIEAIEKFIGEIQHVQYDTFPQSEDHLYYVTVKPNRWSVERFSLYTVMTILFGLFVVAAVCMFYYYASDLFYPVLAALLAVSALPILYLSTWLLNTTTRTRKLVKYSHRRL